METKVGRVQGTGQSNRVCKHASSPRECGVDSNVVQQSGGFLVHGGGEHNLSTGLFTQRRGTNFHAWEARSGCGSIEQPCRWWLGLRGIGYTFSFCDKWAERNTIFAVIGEGQGLLLTI